MGTKSFGKFKKSFCNFEIPVVEGAVNAIKKKVTTCSVNYYYAFTELSFFAAILTIGGKLFVCPPEFQLCSVLSVKPLLLSYKPVNGHKD